MTAIGVEILLCCDFSNVDTDQLTATQLQKCGLSAGLVAKSFAAKGIKQNMPISDWHVKGEGDGEESAFKNSNQS